MGGELSYGGLINFGEFDNASYNMWQLVVFAGNLLNVSFVSISVTRYFK